MIELAHDTCIVAGLRGCLDSGRSGAFLSMPGKLCSESAVFWTLATILTTSLPVFFRGYGTGKPFSSALALFRLFLSFRERAKDFLNDGLDLILLVLGEADHEIFDTGAENGSILGSHI